jgi:DNA-binding response OmpR family regulator
MAASDKNRMEGIRLLLVDEEEEYAKVLSKRMAKRRILVTPALSGGKAIQVLRRQDFDVVILDLKLEDMDSIEVLKILKKMDPSLPVIMLTGKDSEKAAREGLTCGASDYLTKPCELEELLVKIENACRGGGGQVE